MPAHVVRERIDPSITASLFSNYRSAVDAVLELVDNCIDSRIDEQTLAVDVKTTPGTLVIDCEGGEGMGLRDIEARYLRWGASRKQRDRHLGRYGQGGKAAIGHLGQTFVVEASRPGDAMAWRFRDDEYRNRARLKSYEVEETRKRTDASIGYVRIRVGGVDRRIDVRALGQRLAETYRPLLDSGAVTLALDGRLLAPAPMPVDDRRLLSVNAAGRRLRGWVGVVDESEPPSGWKPGFRCYCLGRLIVEGELFGHPGPAHVPGVARLVGEIDLPGVPLTMNKTDFERDSPEWIAIEARMHRWLKPMVDRLARDPDPPAPAAVVKVADAVRRLLGQALRLAERPDLFAGNAPGAATPPAAEMLPLEALPAAERKPPPKPRAAPDQPSIRPSGSRQGFGNVVVRALDPKVRSVTTTDAGVSTIVINSRYPLFVERKGDLLYQLETAAREIAIRAEGDAAEYERRTEQLVLAAIALRSRRRRGVPGGRQLKLLGG